MKILRFTINRLRNEEWFRLQTEFYGLVTTFGAELLGILRVFLLYEVLYKEADQLLEILRVSFATATTTEADRRRSEVYKGLRATIKANLHVLDASLQAAAKKRNAVITKYNNDIQKGGRAAKTAAIDNLLQDLTHGAGSTLDLTAEVQLLNLGRWITDLEASNTLYKQSLAERADKASAKPDTGRLLQVRAEMDHYYLHMINTIDAVLATIGGTGTGDEEEETPPPSGPVEEVAPLSETPDEKIVRFAKTLNFYLTYYKSLLKGRHTRKDAEEGDSEESDSEEGDDEEGDS